MLFSWLLTSYTCYAHNDRACAVKFIWSAALRYFLFTFCRLGLSARQRVRKVCERAACVYVQEADWTLRSAQVCAVVELQNETWHVWREREIKELSAALAAFSPQACVLGPFFHLAMCCVSPSRVIPFCLYFLQSGLMLWHSWLICFARLCLNMFGL